MIFEIEAGGRQHRVDVRRGADGWVVAIDGRELCADLVPAGPGFSLLIRSAGAAARSYEIAIDGRGRAKHVYVDGVEVPIALADPRRLWSRGGQDHGSGVSGPRQIVAPMPGRVVKVLVRPGDAVKARQGLVIVEAMKMENELRSPADGTVAEVRVREGASVEANAVLVVVE